MDDLWNYVGKVGAALLIGLIAVFLALPENRNGLISQFESIQEYFNEDANSLQGSAISSVNTIITEEKLPLPRERTLITTQKKQTYENNCSMQFNTARPDKTINYFDVKLKKDIAIPYNANWGNQLFSVNPFELNEHQQIEFGPLVKDTLCNWKRYFVLEIKPITQNIAQNEACLENIFYEEVDGLSISLSALCNIDLEDKNAYHKDIIESLNIHK